MKIDLKICSIVALYLAMGSATSFGQEPPPGFPPPPPPPTGPQYTLEDIVVRSQPASDARGVRYPTIPSTIVGAEPKGILGGTGAPVRDGREVIAAENGAIPDGVMPLERDVFSSDDFYVDRDLWLDPLYWRCNSPAAIAASQGSGEAPIIGDNFPETVAWGFCDRDYPREEIVSPYRFDTAQDHYLALLGEAESRGGPTKYDHDNPPPDYNGSYSAGISGIGGFGQFLKTRSWMSGAILQTPTYLSLLTPEYQQRMVQQLYHDAHNESVWTAPYCWPDGYLYQWFGSSGGNLLITPDLIQLNSGLNERIVTEIYVGREFNMDSDVPNLTGPARQYWGDSIGFWDGDSLIVWTSNIKNWLAHGMFENSDKFQVVQIYSPIDDREGNFIGLVQESIFYDEEALVEPVRVVHRWQRSNGYDKVRPRAWAQCSPTIYPIDGRQTSVNPGTDITYTVPNMMGRPWDDIWARYFETDMQRPEQEDILSDY